MSDLLNDSATAVKVRDKILAELHPDEQVFYAVDGQILEPQSLEHRPNQFHLLVGAIIVTSERLLVVAAKMMGRAGFSPLRWVDVDSIGRLPDGTVGYKKKIKPDVRWPLWKAQIWEGKSHSTPLDAKALDLLALSSKEAFDAVSKAEHAARVEDASTAYEELKRRRTQQ